MKLEDITVLILTWNEAPNLYRCLDRLRWASRVLVVDSGSSDGTRDIVAKFSQVEIIERPFDSFAGQCNFGLEQIRTEWVLSIDADYILPADFSLHAANLSEKTCGYRFPFRYCVEGEPLRATLYPPRTVLYRRKRGRYQDDGHGHRVEIEGAIIDVAISIDHDDRKSLARWLDSQRKYVILEALKLQTEKSTIGWPDRLRKMIWPASPALLLYLLFARGLIFDGWSGIYYVLQRTYAELLLSLELLDRKIRHSAND